MKRIVWLASYPKSGNTWFRAFLANFLRDGDRPVNINHLGIWTASERWSFDEALGYDSSDLSFDEIDALRPEVYLHQARAAAETLFLKVHDAYTFLPDGRPLFPPEATLAALCFIRNPLDVCVSFAHHGGHEDYDRMIRRMGNAAYCSCDAVNFEVNQLRMKFSTWSQHAVGWADAPGQRVLVIRYEDMKLRPEETFGAAIRFVGLPDDPVRLKKAIEFSRFDELRAQEEKDGFGEKMAEAKAFFRKGEIGSWRSVLNPEQVAKIVADHGEVMRRFGYLNEQGEPVF
jgi:hypothetical protein